MWIDLDGTVNMRDVGGMPTRDGSTTRFGKVLRSDNLQNLSDADVIRLTRVLGLRDVVDLRADSEALAEGPGPLANVPTVQIHRMSVLLDRAGSARHGILPWDGRDDEQRLANEAASFYLNFLHDRPDAFVSAVRVLAHSEGAALVHCAAGKDRTGVVTAFALDVAGVTRAAIIDDYKRTGERVEAILGRLKASPTYADDLDSRPAHTFIPKGETMRALLDHVDDTLDGPLSFLKAHGWTDSDTAALHSRLVN